MELVGSGVAYHIDDRGLVIVRTNLADESPHAGPGLLPVELLPVELLPMALKV